jgi:xylulokinase
VIETAPIFLPYLNGERTPHNNAQASGMFFGLSSNTDAAAIAYSVMEGVAFSLADGYAALGTAGTRISQAVFVGGGARSRFWGSLVASSCGFALQRPVDGDLGGAFGAARLARMAATGEAAEVVCSSLPGDELIVPSATLAARLKPRYERYKRLYLATNDSALQQPRAD